MYITSNEYKEEILEPTRKFESRALIGNRVITNEELINFNISSSLQQDATFTIGSTLSSMLNLSFLHKDIDTNDRDNIQISLGLEVNGTYEYIPLGVYNIENISSNDSTTMITAYDNMIKFDIPYIENNEKPTVRSIISRLEQLTGVAFEGNINNYYNYTLSKITGYSCREVFGFLAAVLGCNASIARDGRFKFVDISNVTSLNITSENYYDYSKQSKQYKISSVTNSLENDFIEIGQLTQDTVSLNLSNPFITRSILNDLYSKFNNFNFYPYELNFSGDISLDLGDLIKVTDNKGVVKNCPILSNNITFNGALNSIVSAVGDTKLANTYTSKSKEQAELDRIHDDIQNGFENIVIDSFDKETLKIKRDELISNYEDITYQVDAIKENASLKNSNELNELNRSYNIFSETYNALLNKLNEMIGVERNGIH